MHASGTSRTFTAAQLKGCIAGRSELSLQSLLRQLSPRVRIYCDLSCTAAEQFSAGISGSRASLMHGPDHSRVFQGDYALGGEHLCEPGGVI